MNRSKAIAIFNSSPRELSKWEHTDPEYVEKWGHPGGLVLSGCPHCGAFQTRETYVEGFWADVVEIVTDYTCSGIALCKCGEWVSWVH